MQEKIPGGTTPHLVLLDMSDFQNILDGEHLKTWGQLDRLGIFDSRSAASQRLIPEDSSVAWIGPQPEFFRLEWGGPVQ